MGMGVSFQYLMGMGIGMGVIFENGYGCGNSSTRPEPTPLSFLIQLTLLNSHATKPEILASSHPFLVPHTKKQKERQQNTSSQETTAHSAQYPCNPRMQKPLKSSPLHAKIARTGSPLS